MPQPLIDAEADAATNGGRRPTIVAASASASPELSDRPRRRTFTDCLEGQSGSLETNPQIKD